MWTWLSLGFCPETQTEVISVLKVVMGRGSTAPPFFTLAFYGGECSASCHDHWIGGWVGPSACLNAMDETHILPLPGIEPNRPVLSHGSASLCSWVVTSGHANRVTEMEKIRQVLPQFLKATEWLFCRMNINMRIEIWTFNEEIPAQSVELTKQGWTHFLCPHTVRFL